MFDSVFANDFQFNIEIVFFLEYFYQLQEHQGITIEILDDTGVIVDLSNVGFTFFGKKTVNDLFDFAFGAFCYGSHEPLLFLQK
jgi:hypothetical protein